MSGPKFEDHEVTQAEHEFYRSFAVILEHLKNRALNAEAEVRQLRKELEVRRDQVEYLNSIRSTISVAHGTNEPGPQDPLPPT